MVALSSYATPICRTRKFSCVNARGIPTAAYQVLHLLSCTRWGTPPPPTSRDTPGRGTSPSQVRLGGRGTRGGVPPIGVPPTRSDRGVPEVGYPPGWTWLGYPSPCLDLVGVPPPPGVDRQNDGQTRVKTLPSRRTPYAVGNNADADLTVILRFGTELTSTRKSFHKFLAEMLQAKVLRLLCFGRLGFQDRLCHILCRAGKTDKCLLCASSKCRLAFVRTFVGGISMT